MFCRNQHANLINDDAKIKGDNNDKEDNVFKSHTRVDEQRK